MPITIRPKRKGFIWTSFIFCAAEFIVGLVTIMLAIFNLSSKKRHIDVPIITKWRLLMAQIIGLSAALILVAVLGMWIVTKARKRNKSSASFIILVHILTFLTSIYFVASFSELDQRPPMTPEEIFIYTNESIVESSIEYDDPKWVPVWLDTIQEASEKCCGVRTFHDYDSFWFPLKNQVPKSCCLKTRKNCQPNFNKLIYPDLPALNIKLDDGCHAAINQKIKELVAEARKCSISLAIILGFSLLLLCALYVVVFFLKKPPISDNDWEDDDDSSVYQQTTLPNQKSSRAIKFRPEEENWQNLEFYRVKTRKRRGFFGQRAFNNQPNIQGSVPGSSNPMGITISAGIPSSSGLLGARIAQFPRPPEQQHSSTPHRPSTSFPKAQPLAQPPTQPDQVQYKLEPQVDQQELNAPDAKQDLENQEGRHQHIRRFLRREHRHQRKRRADASNFGN